VITAREALTALAEADRHSDLNCDNLATLLQYIAPGDRTTQIARFKDLRSAVRVREDLLVGTVDWSYVEPALTGRDITEAALALIDEQIEVALDNLLGLPYLPYAGHAPHARPITDVPTGGLL
jgi:hypothetical protein